jgi:hypothetical protein
MQIKIFETYSNSDGEKTLNEFLAGEGRGIAVDEIFTAACATEHYARHFVTVVYQVLEQAPAA